MPDLIYWFQTYVKRAKDGTLQYVGSIDDYFGSLLAGKADDPPINDARYYTETEVDTLLAGKADDPPINDARYYTETEVDTLLAGKADDPPPTTPVVAFKMEIFTPLAIPAGTWTTIPWDNYFYQYNNPGFEFALEGHRPIEQGHLGIWHYDLNVWVLPNPSVFYIRTKILGVGGEAAVIGGGTLPYLNLGHDYAWTGGNLVLQAQVWADIAVTVGVGIGNTFFSGHYVGPVITSQTPQTGTVDVQVSSGPDDAHENDVGGSFSHSGANMKVEPDTDANDRYNAGALFRNITVPQGANITAAYYEVVFPASQRDSTRLTTYGHLVPNSSDFATVQDVTGRSRTVASVPWSGDDLGAGVFIQSPDISAIIQEIVNQPTWATDNNLALLFIADSLEGTEKTRFTPYDNTPANACKLHIEWQTV